MNITKEDEYVPFSLSYGSSILIFISQYFMPTCIKFQFYLINVYKLCVNLLIKEGPKEDWFCQLGHPQ